MKYIESEIIELKASLEDDMKTEVVAFLNSYLGGTIYVGVDKNGFVLPLNEKEKDLNESKIINWIRDEAIYPSCTEHIRIGYNEDGVLMISITPGDNKPYYLKEKGPKPSGVYIRYGRNKSQATKEEITRMIMESNHMFYEEMISNEQELTFNYLKLKFEEKKMDFHEFKMITSGFIKNQKYTNLAFIFSDQYDIETKIGIYNGLDRAEFKSKKEFGGSIIKQIDTTLEYYNLCNETRVIIDGSPMRKEYVSYYDKATREAILNCYCHRDYTKRSNIKIDFFDNRCEIISPGGFYGGLNLKDALSGVQSFRNKYLVKLLYKLGYIENYSSGLNRIFKEYKNCKEKPIIETTLNMFKITLPNVNYLCDAQNLAESKNVAQNDAQNLAESKNDAQNDAQNLAENKNDAQNDAQNLAENKNDAQNDAQNISIENMLIDLIINNPTITRKEMAVTIDKSKPTIERIIKKSKRIKYVGSSRSGHWEIVEDEKLINS